MTTNDERPPFVLAVTMRHLSPGEGMVEVMPGVFVHERAAFRDPGTGQRLSWDEGVARYRAGQGGLDIGWEAADGTG